ncbi:MAG: hypothetical protein KTR25_05320 [Myxococcales bacterium]|nr:hypothetical protein [Myxococcales bacterium]
MSSNSGCGDDAVSRVCEGAAPEGGYGDVPDRGARKGGEATDLSHVGNKSENGPEFEDTT